MTQPKTYGQLFLISVTGAVIGLVAPLVPAALSAASEAAAAVGGLAIEVSLKFELLRPGISKFVIDAIETQNKSPTPTTSWGTWFGNAINVIVHYLSW